MHGKSNARIGPVRVLMVSQRLFPYIAGAEQQALGLARALTRAGADVRIVTTRFADGLSARESIDGVGVERISVPFGRSASAAGVGFHCAKVAQILAMARAVASRARSCDLVHSHCLSASSLGSVLGAGLAGVPVLVKPSLGGSDGELRKLLDSPARGLLKAILRRVDRFAVMSDEIAGELQAIGVKAERCASVENGIDLERFSPASEEERTALRARLGLPDGPVALFVGQYVPRKGVRELLEAWQMVRDRVPNATLAFAGHGIEQPVIDSAVREVLSRVVDLGSRSDVVDVIRASDLLVLPTRNESFGNVIIEALACGLPVISGRTGVASRIALDGTAGRYVDPEAPSTIADALVEFLADRARTKELAGHARDLVRRFDFDLIAKAYLGVYEDIRAEARAGKKPVQRRERSEDAAGANR